MDHMQNGDYYYLIRAEDRAGNVGYSTEKNWFKIERSGTYVTPPPYDFDFSDDLDGDGIKEIIVGCNDGLVYAWSKDATPLAGWPAFVGSFIPSKPAICDIDLDRPALQTDFSDLFIL